MKRGTSIFFAAAVIGALALTAGVAWWWGVFRSGSAPAANGAATVLPPPHVYNDPGMGIAKVRLKVVYAVPQGESTSSAAWTGWKDDVAATLQDAARFHALQFQGRSAFSYDIFPQEVVLQHNDLFYDTTSTNDGNPHGLINVGEEIDRRVMKPDGDLYDAAFAAKTAGEYDVMAIVYGGVGASGGMIYDTPLQTPDEIAAQIGVPASVVYIVNVDSVEGFFIVSRDYFTKSDLRPIAATVLYHEFAHTIGLPDLFDGNDAPSSTDIMGEGRWKSIDDTYIGADFLQGMGI